MLLTQEFLDAQKKKDRELQQALLVTLLEWANFCEIVQLLARLDFFMQENDVS